MFSLSRWTARSFLQPTRFVAPEALPEGFDLEEWAHDYRWEPDDWNGYQDTISPIEETVRTARGDCDDFAAVAASWAVREHRERIGFAYLWESGTDWWPTHMVCYDEERVYSSGAIADRGLTDWVAHSDYNWAIRRQIRYW